MSPWEESIMYSYFQIRPRFGSSSVWEPNFQFIPSPSLQAECPGYHRFQLGDQIPGSRKFQLRTLLQISPLPRLPRLVNFAGLDYFPRLISIRICPIGARQTPDGVRRHQGWAPEVPGLVAGPTPDAPRRGVLAVGLGRWPSGAPEVSRLVLVADPSGASPVVLRLGFLAVGFGR